MPGTYDQESKGNDTSLNQGQKPEEKVPAGQQKGVLMLANPSDRDLWVYPDPSNKNNYTHHPTPLSVRVDESDVKKAKRGDKEVEFVKVTEIPDEKVTNPGYARKASIQSYAAFQALDHFGITDETERNIFMANADHESGRCTTLAEGTNYTDPTKWSEINGQSAAVARAYGESFNEVFSKWTAQDKANNMYGIEGKNYAESKGEKPKSGKWTADSLSNTQNDDGWRFRGRGVIQITGRGHFTDLNNNLNAVDPATGETNYEKASGNKGKKVDVVKNPELVTEDQFIAYYSGAWFWKSVAQGRISNTLAKNSATLGGATTLAGVQDSATAVKIGRKAVAGNSTDLSVNPHGLDKVQNNYTLDAAKYSAAYANYKAEQTNGGNVSTGGASADAGASSAAVGAVAGAATAVEVGTAAVSAGTQQAQDVTGTNQPVVENTTAASVSSGLEINAEGHPIYYPKGAQDTKDRIKWNRDRNYTTEYIKSFQKLIGTDPDGDIGTNTVNAIRHYQELNGLEQDGKWGRECATASGLERKYIGDASTGAGSSSGTTTVDGGTLPEVTVIGEKPSGDQQSGGQQQTSGTDISAHETSADSYSIISTNPDATAATKYHSGIPSDAVPMRITGNKNTKDGFIHPVKDHLAYYVSAENGWSDNTGNLNTKAGSFTVKDSECSPVDSYQSHKTLQYIRNYQVGDEVKISSAGRFLKDTSSEAKENRVEVYNNDFVSKIESIEEGPTGKFYQVKYHDKLGFVHCRYVTQSSNEISPEQLQVLQANANNWLGYNTRELSNSNSEYSKYITWSTNYSRNCANFVSYQLMCAGILDKVYPGCSGLSSALKDKGWGSKLKKDAVKDEHKPEYGDVWFSNGMGHTELVTSTSGTTVNLIGSNNRDHNSQVVSKSSAGDNDHIYSRFYK